MSEKSKKYIIVFKLYDGTTRHVPIEIPLGEDGAPGGYYTPEVNRVSDKEIVLSFTPSNPEMPAVEPINLSNISPDVNLEKSESGFKLTITDESGTEEVEIYNGFSTYYLDQTVTYPTQEDSMTAQFSVLSNNGERVKAGDLLISRNGTLCVVIEVGDNYVRHRPTASFYSEVKGEPGYSVYSVNREIEYPSDGLNFYLIAKNQFSNGGDGIKVGDLAITTNGTLCSVEEITSFGVRIEPFASIAGAHGTSGTDGYSIFYTQVEIAYPVDGIATHMIAKTQLSNGGYGIKVGDLIISSNGTLCNVTEVRSSHVKYEPVANIGGENGGREDLPTFSLKDLGVPPVPLRGGHFSYDCDMTEFRALLDKGNVVVTLDVESVEGGVFTAQAIVSADWLSNNDYYQINAIRTQFALATGEAWYRFLIICNVFTDRITMDVSHLFEEQVLYTKQNLTEEQKEQARKNLGITGTGADGKAGYTPVKGTDYWTDADKAEIKAYVDEAILGGEW